MPTQRDHQQELVDELADLLTKGNAHATLDDALEGISFDLLGEKPGNLPYSIYQLAAHIQLAQWDILEFSRNPNYVSPKWPEGYWPSEAKPKSKAEWENCVRKIKSDTKEFVELLKDQKGNLYEPFSYGDGQTLLREALVLADHNSYHAGEIILLRKLLNDWKK